MYPACVLACCGVCAYAAGATRRSWRRAPWWGCRRWVRGRVSGVCISVLRCVCVRSRRHQKIVEEGPVVGVPQVGQGAACCGVRVYATGAIRGSRVKGAGEGGGGVLWWG